MRRQFKFINNEIIISYFDFEIQRSPFVKEFSLITYFICFSTQHLKNLIFYQVSLFRSLSQCKGVFNIKDMKQFINLIALLFFITIGSSKLVQVVTFTRHGSRYVLNNLYDGNDTRYIWGQLTSTGYRQHQSLGEIFRKEYIQKLGFISPTYNRHEIQVYSTAINRTVQSIISQLYGVYPLGSGPKLLPVDKQYYLPPFSNKTDDDDKTFAIPKGYQAIPVRFNQKIMMDDCLNQQRQMNKNIETQLDQYRQMNMTYWPFIKKMTTTFNLTGMNVTLATLSTLNSDLQCHLNLGRPMPDNFSPEDQTNIRHIDSWYKQFTFVKDLAKACNRDRFIKIIGMFEGRIKNPKQAVKFTFLSGHDLDMVPMYNDLNLSSSRCVQELYRKGQTSALNCEQFPSFASSLIFELFQNNGVFVVKIRSNGKYMKMCNKNSTQCQFNDWKSRVENNLASESLADNICGKKTSLEPEQQGKQNEGFGTMFRKAYEKITKIDF